MEKAYNYQKENGFVEFGCGENYHMDFSALQNFMPEKAKLVQKVFEKEGAEFLCGNRSTPHPHSIPVYDMDSGKVYYSMTLDRVKYEDYKVKSCISLAVRKSVDLGVPVNCIWDTLKGSENVHLHHFIAVEDVPLKILKVAVERQLHPEINEKEVNDINNFLKASKELDNALYEAKRLLKE